MTTPLVALFQEKELNKMSEIRNSVCLTTVAQTVAEIMGIEKSEHINPIPPAHILGSGKFIYDQKTVPLNGRP